MDRDVKVCVINTFFKDDIYCMHTNIFSVKHTKKAELEYYSNITDLIKRQFLHTLICGDMRFFKNLGANSSKLIESLLIEYQGMASSYTGVIGKAIFVVTVMNQGKLNTVINDLESLTLNATLREQVNSSEELTLAEKLTCSRIKSYGDVNLVQWVGIKELIANDNYELLLYSTESDLPLLVCDEKCYCKVKSVLQKASDRSFMSVRDLDRFKRVEFRNACGTEDLFDNLIINSLFSDTDSRDIPDLINNAVCNAGLAVCWREK